MTLAAAWVVLLLGGAWSIRPRHAQLARARRRLDRRIALAIVAAPVALAVPRPLLVALLVFVGAVPLLRARRAHAERVDAIGRSLPEIVDLFHLAIGAGLTVPLAVDAVVRRADGPLAHELACALDEVAVGRRLADALADVPDRAGELTRPLIDALVASDRYGAPLGDALARLASDVRADRRRRAEEAARKVPVKLLFPLVCCVLPAFGLLTLAPLIAGAASALRP